MKSKCLTPLAASALFVLAGKTEGFAFTNPASFVATRQQPRTTSTGALRMSVENPGEGGTVCLITGSSRGIGKCIAMELVSANKDARIVINHIAPEKDNADKVVAEITELGSEAIAVEADCSQPDQIKAMFKTIKEEFGRCDILVNNAGIARDGLMLRMKPEQWQQVIDINLSGVYYCSQEFFKQAVRNHSGRVVNIASVVGQIGNAGQCNYSAAKAGVIGLTKSNAKEFASRNIKVNAVCPGFIQTPMTDALGEEYLEEISKTVPLGRLGKPEEVAGLVRFLAFDKAADYMTGHTYDVDGGIAIGV